MVRFDLSLSTKYFRTALYRRVRFWVGRIIGIAYLAYTAKYLYELWFFGILFKIAHGIWFYLILFCALLMVRSLILTMPAVKAWRAKRKKLRWSYTFSDEGIKVDVFNGKMESSHIYSFNSVKKAEEKDKYFTISYVSSGAKEYLFKSDITEGSAEELRQLFADNLGDKFRR